MKAGADNLITSPGSAGLSRGVKIISLKSQKKNCASRRYNYLILILSYIVNIVKSLCEKYLKKL